ncbi:MAG: SMC-Scp complex subunit ScpB [Syntrophomonas sp.]|nr:SMC-Scp complex subunit ScpB [Syntrophomonas sp.]
MLMRDQIKAAVEAVLFVRASRVGKDELVEILDIPLLELKEILQEMILEYNNNVRGGLQIIELDVGYMLCTRPAYSDILSRMEKPLRKRLSAAALDTLAIVAYRQPITRAEIEQIRGVKSDRIVNTLMEKGLIEEVGHKAVLGKPVLYATTEEFLKVFGLTGLKELPDLEES